MLSTSPPQYIIPTSTPLGANAAVLLRPWGHVHVQLLLASLRSSATLIKMPKTQHTSRSTRGKASFQGFPLATTDPRSWKSHAPRIDKYGSPHLAKTSPHLPISLYMFPHKVRRRPKFNSLNRRRSLKRLPPLQHPQHLRLLLLPHPPTLLSPLITPDG
jgi:hypothetical protein